MAHVSDTKLLYNPVGDEMAHKHESMPAKQRYEEMNMITKILIWRTAALLKIASYIYKELISEIEIEERRRNRRKSINTGEFSNYVADLVRARSRTHHRLEEHNLSHNAEVYDQA